MPDFLPVFLEAFAAVLLYSKPSVCFLPELKPPERIRRTLRRIACPKNRWSRLGSFAILGGSRRFHISMLEAELKHGTVEQS